MTKKIAAAIILAALSVASLPSAVDAARRPKPKNQNFYLHWDDPAGDCSGPSYVNTKDTPDAGDGCGYTLQRFGVNEVLIAAGQGLSRDWIGTRASFTLDATKPIKGHFAVNGWAHPVQAGNAVLEVEILGNTKNSSETLASVSQEYQVTPAGGNVVDFEVEPDAKFNKKKFTGLSIRTTMRGIAVGQHYIDLEVDPAHVTLSVLK